jgi:hypothetical protein
MIKPVSNSAIELQSFNKSQPISTIDQKMIKVASNGFEWVRKIPEFIELLCEKIVHLIDRISVYFKTPVAPEPIELKEMGAAKTQAARAKIDFNVYFTFESSGHYFKPQKTCPPDDFFYYKNNQNGSSFRWSSSQNTQRAEAKPSEMSQIDKDACKLLGVTSPSQHREILGVGPNATDKDIGKAYRKAALNCHPDKNLGNEVVAESALKMLNTAKDALLKTAPIEKREQQQDEVKPVAVSIPTSSQPLLLPAVEETQQHVAVIGLAEFPSNKNELSDHSPVKTSETNADELALISTAESVPECDQLD